MSIFPKKFIIIFLQQQQQHSLLSQVSWGRLEVKPKRHKDHNNISKAGKKVTWNGRYEKEEQNKAEYPLPSDNKKQEHPNPH